MTTDATLVIIGASLAGAKAAEAARTAGFDGRVVLIGDEVFRRLHADNGVQLRLRTRVEALRGSDTVERVVLSNGDVETADVVVIGVGVSPRDDLAAAAGMKVDNGLVVDEHLRTSAPGVYAAGDVASAWHPHYGHYLRVEHWSNALNQGLTAGVNATGGAESYTRLPYFFSDQYDLGMEYVGSSNPRDAVAVRGSLTDREFIAFWHRHGVVTAAMNVNVWDVIDDLKSIIAAGRTLEPARLADAAVPLAELA